MNTLRTLLICCAILAGGCNSTVTPRDVPAAVASFDGNEQNSGFLGFFSDGAGHITAHARDRYNALVASYGREFPVPLSADAGLVALADGTYRIDAEHLSAFLQMSAKRRSGIAPFLTRP